MIDVHDVVYTKTIEYIWGQVMHDINLILVLGVKAIETKCWQSYINIRPPNNLYSLLK